MVRLENLSADYADKGNQDQKEFGKTIDSEYSSILKISDRAVFCDVYLQKISQPFRRGHPNDGEIYMVPGAYMRSYHLNSRGK